MKELDLLLEHFIENHRRSLAEGSWPELEALLQTEDDVLWDWLQDPSGSGSDSPYRELLARIRSGKA